jgi:DNA-binding NarL/FixJ family response regulator
MYEVSNGLFPELPELLSPEEWEEVGTALELSQRQQQVARLICLGWPVERMARELGLDESGVIRHMHGLFRHLRVCDAVGVPVRVVVALRSLEQAPRWRS